MKKLPIFPPITNACGILSYLPVFEYLEEIGLKNMGAGVSKSSGPMEKLGNINPTVYWNGNVLMNSFALPSMEPEDFEKELEQYGGKIPLILSHYGNSPEDYARSVVRFDKYGIGHEINISCPNFEPGEKSVMKAMCNTEKGVGVIKAVRGVTDKPVITKLSPNEDYVAIAKAVAQYTDYIGCGNTIGPGLEIDPYSGYPILTGKFGGLSGDAIRPITMKMVHEIYQAVGDEVGIVASGGISKSEHIISYARLGASIFQIGTVLRGKNSKETVEFFNDLWDGVENILKELKKKSINEIIGENHVK